jgi:DivIVA domain-containing protein
MPLTPEDVVNKRFQPTKFREGYDQDEVDDFLDEIVVELRRLNHENEDLRSRLLASEGRISELQRSGAGLVAQIQAPVAETVVTPSAFPEPVADPSTLDSSNTNNLLQLARKLHDEHVAEGMTKRDALIAEGHATAARLVREAEAAQRAELSRYEREKALVEHSISELKAYEREYRLKLKAFIESQLADLESPSFERPAAQRSQHAAPATGSLGDQAALGSYSSPSGYTGAIQI